MASAKHYRQQITDLGLDRLEIRVSSLAEARESLKEIRALQKELRQIKRNVNLEMKTIRAAYRQQISTAASTSSGVATLLGKRKLAGRLRADEKRRLSRERDEALKPCEGVKLTIDNLLVQMDSAKVKLEAFIEEAKAKEQAEKQTARSKEVSPSVKKRTNYCPQCGSPVEESDKFCRECGHALR